MGFLRRIIPLILLLLLLGPLGILGLIGGLGPLVLPIQSLVGLGLNGLLGLPDVGLGLGFLGLLGLPGADAIFIISTRRGPRGVSPLLLLLLPVSLTAPGFLPTVVLAGLRLDLFIIKICVFRLFCGLPFLTQLRFFHLYVTCLSVGRAFVFDVSSSNHVGIVF